MTIKLFTIVKDEIDIVKDWVYYHGSIFGYNNLFIIDNFSKDGTYETLYTFKGKINIFRRPNYKLKGQYMKSLINTFCQPEDIAFPIDIDEFITYFDGKNIYSDTYLINNYIERLPRISLYKSNYIYPVNKEKEGYERATTQSLTGNYFNMGCNAKTFFNTSLYKGPIDHGNHIQSKNYFLSSICLVHYHCRNFEQMKKKVLNNVIGLGYPNNLRSLEIMMDKNPECQGNQHVKQQINILKGTYIIPFSTENGKIDLNPIINKVIREEEMFRRNGA